MFEVLLADHVELSTVTEQLVSIPTCACFHAKTFLDISISYYILSIYFAGINVTTALSNPQKQFVKVSG